MPYLLRVVRAWLALTFPHTSLLMQALKELERKIDGKQRSETKRLAMHFGNPHAEHPKSRRWRCDALQQPYGGLGAPRRSS